VFDRPHYTSSTARHTRVIGRFKCDAGDRRSDKIDPCAFAQTPPKTDLRDAATRAGTAKWQLVVLDARAIGATSSTMAVVSGKDRTATVLMYGKPVAEGRVEQAAGEGPLPIEVIT
jgi:hypothetical protein